MCVMSNIDPNQSQVPSLVALLGPATMAEPKDTRELMHHRAALFWVRAARLPFAAVDLIEEYLKELIAKALWAMNNAYAIREALFRNRWPRSHPSGSREKTYGPGFGMLQPHLFRERQIPQFTRYLGPYLGVPR